MPALGLILAGRCIGPGGRNVPIADNHDLGERPLVAVVQEAEAVVQVGGSSSLTWLALVQR